MKPSDEAIDKATREYVAKGMDPNDAVMFAVADVLDAFLAKGLEDGTITCKFPCQDCPDTMNCALCKDYDLRNDYGFDFGCDIAVAKFRETGVAHAVWEWDFGEYMVVPVERMYWGDKDWGSVFFVADDSTANEYVNHFAR